MYIDDQKCIGCANCVPVCPMNAIFINEKKLAEIDKEVCVECQACYRGMSVENLPKQPTRFFRNVLAFFKLRFQPDPDICPTGAITKEELIWPRIIRRAFSDPLLPHTATGIGGRGTMEVKTNDITERIKEGEAGVTVEFGRPGIGVYFYEVDKACRALASDKMVLEPENPVTALMTDKTKWIIREDVLQEKVLSCILEFKIKVTDLPEVLKTVEKTCNTLNTVVAMGVAIRCDQDGNDTIRTQLVDLGFDGWRGKINTGLGKRINKTASTEASK